jgi:hypothetical protein
MAIAPLAQDDQVLGGNVPDTTAEAGWFGEDVVALLRFNGTDGATTTVDDSPLAHTVTLNSGAQLDDAIVFYGTTSLLVDGVNDYASIPDHADFHITGQFTLSTFIYPTALSGTDTIIAQYMTTGDQRGFLLGIIGGKIRFWYSTAGTVATLTQDFEGGSISVNTRYHVAVTRDISNILRIFVNGKQVASKTEASAFHNSTAVLSCGAHNNGASNHFKGNIDSVLFVNGSCLWTDDFSQPYLEFFDQYFDPGVQNTFGTHYGNTFNNTTGVTGGKGGASSPVPMQELTLSRGTLQSPVARTTPDIECGGSPYQDFYFRIWVVPEILRITNARIDFPYEYEIWNAYLQSNTLNTVTPVGAGSSSVSTNITTPEVWGDLEIKTKTISIDETAPIEVNVVVTYDFTNGDGFLTFIALRTAIIDSVPDVPITEILSWKTDIISSYKGDEQRIALLDQPRREIRFKLITNSVEQSQKVLDRIYVDSGATVVVPFYQYSTFVTADGVPNDTVISIDTSKTDIRVGETVFFKNPSGDFSIHKVNAFDATTVTITPGLEFNVFRYTLFGPAFDCYASKGTSFNRLSVDDSGTLNITCTVVGERDNLDRPSSTGILTTFTDGKTILDKRPLADNPIQNIADSNFEILDFETSKVELLRPWTYPKLGRRLVFKMQRIPDPEADFDYFRLFLETMRGKQKSFYIPSYRQDLSLNSVPADSAGILDIKGLRYSGFYFDNPAFKQLAIFTASGVHYTVVSSVTPDVNLNDQVQLATPLPTGAGWTQISAISFLMLSRLASDEIALTHQSLDTFITLPIKSVDL